MTIEETKATVREVIGEPTGGTYTVSDRVLDSVICLAYSAGGMDQAQRTMRRFDTPAARFDHATVEESEAAYRRSINAEVPKFPQTAGVGATP